QALQFLRETPVAFLVVRLVTQDDFPVAIQCDTIVRVGQVLAREPEVQRVLAHQLQRPMRRESGRASLRAPVVFFARHVRSALNEQDALAAGRQAIGQRSTARARADDDDVKVFVHDGSWSVARGKPYRTNLGRDGALRQTKMHQANFSLKKYGTWSKATRAGKQWLNKTLPTLPPRVESSSRDWMTRRNHSGVVGVYRSPGIVKKRNGNVYECPRWVARWPG